MIHLPFLFLVLMNAWGFAAPEVVLKPVVLGGLKNPVEVGVLDKDRLYIVEQRGRVRICKNGSLVPEPWLNIEEHVTAGGEMGLLSLAPHPKFAENKKYYVNYTASRPGLQTIIAEYTEGSPTERILLTFDQPYTNHNGGQLLFDTQGFLLIATGDGGDANDPHGNGQSLNTLLGKILRIDVDHKDEKNGFPYSIPSDNPFVNKGGRKEIFAYGLRNPWRVSRDSKTGALFTGDVGQNRYEEVDLIERGKNYGWNTMEGKHCLVLGAKCNTAGLTFPLWEYGRREGYSITGGFVYRGSKIPEFQGVYIYGDYGTGNIWGLTYDQESRKTVKNELLLQSRLPISSFGEDADKEILVVSHNGGIHRLTKK